MTVIRDNSRREFLNMSAAALAGTFLPAELAKQALAENSGSFKAKLSAHMWVYASKYPPDWDATPVLETVFSDLQKSGFDGLEVMDVILRHDDSVERLKRLEKQYKLPISGASYQGPMWDATKHDDILKDATTVITRLGQLQGKTLGISVGDAGRLKTEAEFDAQAKLLRSIQTVCANNGVVANLHNHTYEVRDDLHDLKGTLARIPDIKLGPDLNWLIRGGVDPVAFIRQYASQIVFMHLRDQGKDGRWVEAMGEGVTDFVAIGRALHDINYNGDAVIELAHENDLQPARPLRESLKISREFVRQTMGY